MSIKRLVSILYVLMVAVLATATIIEHYKGTQYTSDNIYSSVWFSSIWLILTISATIFYGKSIFKKKFNNLRISNIILHASFIVILAGALLTHLTSYKGIVHLRMLNETSQYFTVEKDQMVAHPLPFSIKLTNFKTNFYPGTSMAADYSSEFVIRNGKEYRKGIVSMNKIFSHDGIRLYQNGYDDDQMGSYLTINSDPYGIPTTYLGYALLFMSLLWMLINPQGTFMNLVKLNIKKHKNLSLCLFLLFVGYSSSSTAAATTVQRQSAEKFGHVLISTDNRIMPIHTFSAEFTKKINGNAHYKNYSPEQVLLGWMLFFDQWRQEPFIRVKSSAVREKYHLNKYVSLNSFFVNDEYIFSSALRNFAADGHDAMQEEIIKLDDKLQLIFKLRDYSIMRIFPHNEADRTIWYSPTDSLPADIDSDEAMFIRNVFPLLADLSTEDDTNTIDKIFDRTTEYQIKRGGDSIPTNLQMKAEYLYDDIPMTTILFMVNLTMGLFGFFIFIIQSRRNKSTNLISPLFIALLICSFLALTFTISLRWIITGKVPMSNGYETMLLLSWFVMLLGIISYRFIRIMSSFGLLLSGFFLLVSHISQMDPNIGNAMPVLNSPILSIHVSVIMLSYAFLSLTFICSLAGLISKKDKQDKITREMMSLSLLFLYPAITTLAFGIFIGAIWANISWGTYWSWDPKETWALITLMVYAVALHRGQISFLNKPKTFHIYIVVAYLTIIMTFFGVNYILGGMHSYA